MSASKVSARHSLVILAVIAVGLLLTGCLRSETTIDVGGDGSGTTAIEVYFDEVELDAAHLSQDDLIKLVKTATRTIDGADVSAVGTQGSRGFRVSIPFDDYRQLTQALTTGEYGGVSTRLFQSFQITEGTEGHWSMNAVVDPAGFRAVLSQIPAGFGGSATQLDAGTEFVFSVALPGKVMRSNASSVDGGTARWELKGDTEAVTFTMDNEPAGFTPLQLILAAIAALFLVGFILILTTAAGSRHRWQNRRGRRRRKKGKPVDPSEQWQPKVPQPGTVGGRDESVLPVMAGAATADQPLLPPVAPPIGLPPLGETTLGGIAPAEVGAHGADPAPVDAPTAPWTAGSASMPPASPVVPEAPPVSPSAAPPVAPPVSPSVVPPVAPVVPSVVPPVAPVVPSEPPTVPPPYEPAEPSASAGSDAPAPGGDPSATASWSEPAIPPSVTPPPYVPTESTPPESTPPESTPPESPVPAAPDASGIPPTPSPPPAPAVGQPHWLAPNPHEDPTAHWLDHPPPEEAPADPDGWVHLPPRSSEVPRFEYPEVHDI